MPVSDTYDITGLLKAWCDGDQEAFERMFPIVYDELRRIAGRCLRDVPRDRTLRATVLVHEAYLKLVDWRNVSWQNRAHFFGAASKVMRNIVVDYAREHASLKRDGGQFHVAPTGTAEFGVQRAPEMLAIDDALTKLEAVDPHLGRLVEMRFFGGMTVEETAEAMRISPATVKRDWTAAKAYLTRELRKLYPQ